MKTNLPSRSVDGCQIANAWFNALTAAVFAAVLICPASVRAQSQPQPPQPQPPQVQPNPMGQPPAHTPVQTPAPPSDWPKQQTPELTALRLSSSPAEKKLSFNLLLLTRQVRKAPLGSFASMLDTSEVNADGTVTVDITAYLSPSLMASPVMANVVRINGGTISEPAYVSDHLRAKVYKWQLLDLAANPNVLSIRDVDSSANGPSMAANTVSPAIPAGL
jgi:hypothetical protein